MASPFDSFIYRTAEDKIKTPAWFKVNYKLAFQDDPDHFLGGEGFIGPSGNEILGSTEAEKRASVNATNSIQTQLQRAFTPKDVLSEVVQRRADGIFGIPAALRPGVNRKLEEGDELTEEEKDTLYEAKVALLWWMRERGFQGLMNEAARAATAFRYAYLRLFVPVGRLKKGQVISQGGRSVQTYRVDARTLREAMEYIFVEVVLPDKAAYYTDPDEYRTCGIVKVEGRERVDGRKSPDTVEVSYLDYDDMFGPEGDDSEERYPMTVLRVMDRNNWVSIKMPLRGRRTIFQIKDRKLFVDEPMRRMQFALNTASTERRIVNDDAGFPTRLLLGASPPGKFVEDEGGRLKFVPEPLTLRPRDIVHVSGQQVYDPELTDQEGDPVVTGLTTPSAATFEAANPKNYADEVRDRTLDILERARQLYVAIAGDATTTGVSRQQAKDEFLQDAAAFQEVCDPVANEVLEAVLDMAAYFMNDPGRFYFMYAGFESRLNIPAPMPEERLASVTLMREGVWSTERTMEYNQVDNPEEEADLIRQEAAQRAAAFESFLPGAQMDPEEEDENPVGEPDDPNPPVPGRPSDRPRPNGAPQRGGRVLTN